LTNKPDGFLLASLPSSGSDWFADCICKADPSLRYAREYFSPTCNLQHASRLEQVVGDTLAGSLSKLVTPASCSSVAQLLDDTWRRDNYNFTKENYLPFHLSEFQKWFDVVILLREFKHTFPPRRHRVMQWYEHFYVAMAQTNRVPTDNLSVTHRAAAGHYWMVKQYVDVAKRHNIPVIWWGDLQKGVVNPTSFLSAQCLEVMSKTKKQKEQASVEYKTFWASALHYYAELETLHGALK
jgi:hypothetical protein